MCDRYLEHKNSMHNAYCFFCLQYEPDRSFDVIFKYKYCEYQASGICAKSKSGRVV